MWALCLEGKVFPTQQSQDPQSPFTWAHQEGPRQPSEGVVLTWGQANMAGGVPPSTQRRLGSTKGLPLRDSLDGLARQGLRTGEDSD